MAALVDDETEMFLTEWGKWTRMGGPEPKGARSWLGVMQERLVQQNRGPGLNLSDDFCDGFDRIVMRAIKAEWPQDYRILTLYYADRLPSRKLAGVIGVSKTSGLELLKMAIGRAETLVKAGVAA